MIVKPKKCEICKAKYIPSKSTQRVCSLNCAFKFAEKSTEKKVKEERKKDREAKREIDVSGAMRLADMYFSRYIRLFHSVDGECTCYTCGTIKEVKEVDNGHYEKRAHKSTRYHENNCRPQCKICNGDTKHNGKQAEFRVNLAHEIGEEEVLAIERLARTPIKANSVFYRNIADTYRNKLNELQKLLKIKLW
jgi:hypothetical protein